MFRSILFTLVTLAFLSGAFFLYWHAQPAVVPQTIRISQATTAPTTAPTDDTEMSIGPGRRGWANSFDDTGHLSSQFTAAEFTPQKDGTFKVIRPVNVFYLNDGQYMVVTGENGLVYVDSAAGGSGKTSPMQAGMQSPNRGLLQQVHIALYPTKTSEHATLWMDVNNLSFDNDTLRLYTQSYQDANGATVPADMVPVTVRGDDYEFDGTGLTIRWNGRDRHLHLLEVAHGGRLEIKNPSKMSMPMAEPPHARLGDAPLPEALASTSPPAVSAAMASTSVAPTTSPSAIAYRAVFNDAVRVLQGERQVARADMMTVDFLPAAEKSAPTTAPNSPTTAPTLVKVESEQKAPTAAQKLADRAPGAATTQPSDETIDKSKATPPPNPPVTIYWTGKLRVTPLDSDPVLPITLGQSAIRLVGSPVILTPEGSTVRAAVVTYRNPDGAAVLETSPTQPLVDVKQDRGMTFTAQSVNYDPTKALAVITGKSILHLLDGNQQQLNASWTDRGVIHFAGKAMQRDSVDQVDLFGNVKADHPMFTLNSNQLTLALEKAAIIPPDKKSGLTLKRATASGNVQCRMLRPNQPSQEIDGDDLVLGTVPGQDGKTLPRTVVVDGHVKAIDDTGQELHAGHLEALLRPQTKSTVKDAKADAGKSPANEMGAVEMESLDATTNVHAILKDGATADADTMHVTTHVTMKDDKEQVETQVQLIGQPAKISDGTGRSLSAPVVQISPELGTMNAQGAGTIHTLGLTEDGKAAGPVVVTWAKSLALDSKANTADVIGNVLVTTTDNDGAINTVAGDTAHLDLMDAAPAKEAKETKDTKEKKENKKASATQPGSEFGDKGLKALTLSGNVVMHSLLNAADGTVAAEKVLNSSKLIYNHETGHAEMPGPGSLVVLDNRTNTKSAKPDKADKTDVGHGNMAMTWQTGLVYDKTKQTIVVQGKVVSGFKKPTDAAPVNLKAEVVTIDLVPSSTTAQAADSALGSMHFSHFRAEDDVDLRGEKPSENGKPSKVYTADCNRLDYDPGTDLVTLRGKDDQAPGEFLAEQQASPLYFLVMVFNIKTQQIVSSEGGRGTLRK